MGDGDVQLVLSAIYGSFPVSRVSFADPGPSSDLLLSAGLGAQIDMLLSMS